MLLPFIYGVWIISSIIRPRINDQHISSMLDMNAEVEKSNLIERKGYSFEE